MEKDTTQDDAVFETLNTAFQKRLAICRNNYEAANAPDILPQDRDELLKINAAMEQMASRELRIALLRAYENKPVSKPVFTLLRSLQG